MLASSQNTTRLDGRATTIVFGSDDGVPTILYHGPLIDHEADLAIIESMGRRPVLPGSLDLNEPISMHPEIGRGFLGHPAMIGNRSSISAPGWAGRFVMTSRERLEDGVSFRLSDSARALELEIQCRLDPRTDVATFVSRLRNAGDTPFEADWFSAPVLTPEQHFSEHLSFHGRWCAEFDIERQAVQRGLTKHENRRGRTSHEAFPGIILLNPNTDEENGPCVGVHLGWSGNHRIILERLSTGDVQVQMGVLLFSGEGRLAPGAGMETPPLYVARSSRGLNTLSRKLHAHVRAHILKMPDPAAPRPVTVNTWEEIYFNHRHDALVSLADAAAEIGAERFVLDDGWFQGRNDDTGGLGDWHPDDIKYPNGLEPIASHVRGLGMQFGLWVEPEMVNENSGLFCDHPDWVLGLGDYPRLTGRNQLVLDLANPMVGDYLFERLSALIADHKIAYLKWDMNRDLVLPGDRDGKATVHRQTHALYDLLDRLLERFRSPEIESCASGGGRVDYGILKRTHRFWTSDSNDAVERMRIQTGFSYFFPPEIMGAHIGSRWSHTSGRGSHAGYRTLVAGYGHMGIEADLTKMDRTEREIIRSAVERYKADRNIWHAGAFSRIRTVDPELLGAATTSIDRRRARLIVVQCGRPRSMVPPRIHLDGLDRERAYRVRMQFRSEMVDKANRRFDNPIWNDGYECTGEAIALAGIGLPSLYAQTGVAIAIDAVDSDIGGFE